LAAPDQVLDLKLIGQIWRRWINAEKKQPITMFFGVPTVYCMPHRPYPGRSI
jgi:hypothetical protein